MPPIELTAHEATELGGDPSARTISSDPDASTAQESKKLMSEKVQALKLDKKGYGAKKRRPKRWIWVLLLLVVACCAAWMVQAYLSGTLPRLFGGLIEVDAVRVVSEQPIEIVLDTTGYVVPHSTVQITPLVAGTVVELYCEEGGKVVKGQILARLEDAPARADYEQAKAGLTIAESQYQQLRKGAREEDVEQARAALEQAKARAELQRKELARAEQLKDAISPSEYDRAEAAATEADANVRQLTLALQELEAGPTTEEIATAAAEVERAKAMVAKTQFYYDSTQIRAPVSGTVLKRSVDLGEMIRPESLTKILCEIAASDVLEAEIDIPERDLAKIHKGQPCRVTTEAFPDRVYQGRLRWLSPVYNRQRGVRSAKVEILDPDEMLAPEMNCRVQILEKEPPSELVELIRIPGQAILQEASGTFVYVCKDGVVEWREVETGQITEGLVEIRSGLCDGELLLLAGDEPLKDGQAVRTKVESVGGQ